MTHLLSGRVRVAVALGALVLAIAGPPRRASANTTADSVTAIRVMLDARHYKPAESRARVWLARLGTGAGSDTARAAALDLLTEALLNGGDWSDSACAIAADAVRAQEQVYGAESPETGNSLIAQGRMLYRAGDWEAARSPTARGLALCERAYGERHRSVMRGLRYLANLEENRGEFAAAEGLYRRAIAVAETLYGGGSSELGDALNSLGVLCKKTGRYSEARALYERGLAIREKALGPDSPDLVFNLNNLANVVGGLGDVARARALFVRDLRNLERAYGREHPYYSFVLANLGGYEAVAGDTTSALRDLQEAVSLAERSQGRDHPDLASPLDDLGELWTARGEYARAQEALERALSIRIRAYGPDHTEVAKTLAYRASLRLARGEIAAADSDAHRALAIRERTFGPANREIAESLIGLSNVRRAAGDDSMALAFAVRGEATGLEHFRLTARVLEERIALQYAATRPSGLDLALSIAADHATEPAFVAPAWEALVRSRARVLDEMARRHRTIAAHVDSVTAALVDSMTAAEEQLAWLIESGADAMPGGSLRIGRTQERKERFEFELAARSAVFRQEEALENVRLGDIGRALGPGHVLIAFARYSQAPPAGRDLDWYLRPDADPLRARYIAFVRRGGDSLVRAVPLGPAAEVDSAVARMVREASAPPEGLTRERGEARYAAFGGALRRKVWDPVEPLTRDAAEIFLVPDGALQLVNFAALPIPKGRFLVEAAAPLHQLSAERDLLLARDQSALGHGLIAFGNPDFDSRSGSGADAAPRDSRSRRPSGRASGAGQRGAHGDRAAISGCEDFRSLKFGPLPESAGEIVELAREWRSVSPGDTVLALLGARASETAFRERAPGRRWLHLATHGFFLSGVCKAMGPGGGAITDTIAFENPLLRSGLAFAGANRRAASGGGLADGILTADEIAKLDLSGVEWALLSACETGRGDVRTSEGVLGLRRGLEIAGVRTVVMSLWPVEDRATRAWMKKLYAARLRQHLDVASALRAADLAVIGERRAHGESVHPFFWGAFVAAGDWR